MDILKRAGGRHPKTTREVSLLFSSFWTSSSWRWSCNRCAILMSKNHPKEVGVFPLGCLKNMCIIWENSGKHIYIYICSLCTNLWNSNPVFWPTNASNKSVKKTTPRNLQPLLLAQRVQWDSSRPSFCLKEYTTLHSLPVHSPQHLTDEAQSLFRFNEKNNQEDGELDRFFFCWHDTKLRCHANYDLWMASIVFLSHKKDPILKNAKMFVRTSNCFSTSPQGLNEGASSILFSDVHLFNH